LWEAFGEEAATPISGAERENPGTGTSGAANHERSIVAFIFPTSTSFVNLKHVSRGNFLLSTSLLFYYFCLEDRGNIFLRNVVTYLRAVVS
jgi:hypothetical protein